MRVKFVIPLMDTESGNYEYNGREFSTDDYFSMIENGAIQTNSIMNEFARNHADNRMISDWGGGGRKGLYDTQNVNLNKEIDYEFSESEAVISGCSGEDVSETYLSEMCTSNKKFLLKININPNSMEYDAESDMREWMDDSRMVLSDTSLDKRAMLMSLPLRDFIVDTDLDGKDSSKSIFRLLGCKIIQIYPKEKSGFDFCFAVMVSKIEEQK